MRSLLLECARHGRSNQSDEYDARFDSAPAGCLPMPRCGGRYSQSPADSSYTEVFYPSGSLRIHAFLYKPKGDGPFPVVIYNHGAHTGRPRRPEQNGIWQAADPGWVCGTGSRASRLW